MRYIGIDVSKESLECIALEDEKKPERFKCGTTKTELQRLALWLQSSDTVSIEAGHLAIRLARFMHEKVGCKILVLDPGQLEIIYNTHKKTDREDSLKLARLIQRIPEAELPTIYICSEKEDLYRKLLYEHEYWTKSRTKMINRLHYIFLQAGVTNLKKSNLKTLKGRSMNLKLLSYFDNTLASRVLDSLKSIEVNRTAVIDQMRQILRENKEYYLAMSIPGVGLIATFAFLAYLGDCSRFEKASQVSSYSGLVPKIDCSGKVNRYGRIIKGCRPIKRIIIQSSWSLIRSNCGGPLKEFYERVYQNIGKRKAAVATARKMLESFFAIMRDKEGYWGTDDEFIMRKFKTNGLI